MSARAAFRLLLGGGAALALGAGCLQDADGDGIAAGVDCDDADPAVGLGETLYVDLDGDGYGAEGSAHLACALAEGLAAQAGDCDDADITVHPGAIERWYDGVDQDCDGADDADADGDGYAAEVVGGDDCDDSDPAVHPGAVDAPYDGLDSDCGGGSDFDQDGDGWDLADDCDDLDPGVNPGVAEVWYDGLDADCGGGSDFDQDGDGWDLAGDCDDLDPAVSPGATETWYDGLDSDCSGGSDDDQDGDGHDLAEDCDDLDPEVHPGAFEWHDGDDDDCDGREDIRDLGGADWTLRGEATGDRAGTFVAAAGDVDGDGRADFLIGAPGWRDGVGLGALYLVVGGELDAAHPELDLWDATARFDGEAAGDALGTSAAVVGDLDGDGWVEVLAGAPGAAGGAGQAWLWRGPFAGEYLPGADAETFGTAEPGVALGQAVAGGADLDDDGAIDLLLGAPGASSARGAVYLMAAGGDVDMATTRFDGALPGERAGATIALPGDVDGDGLADLLVGAPGRDGAGAGAGAVYLVLGPSQGFFSLASADAILLGEAAGDAAGAALAGGGDVDGDGLADVLVGAPCADDRADDGGAVYLALGPVGSGNLALDASEAVFGGDFDGIMAGSAVAGAGDVDGDGHDDFLIGAPGLEESGAALGAAYLVLGPVTGRLCICGADAKIYGAMDGDLAGSAVALLGDVDGDGYGELLIGAPGGVLAGAVHLLRGAAP
ncbi:MAG: MopE-related protein [Pseudomonadota bacterium]